MKDIKIRHLILQ